MDTTDTARPRESESYERFEEMLLDLSTGFIDLPASEVDGKITDALRRVSEFLDLDLSVLWQWSVEPPLVATPTHFYVAEESMRPPEPLGEELYPYYVRQVLSGRIMSFSSPDELPEEAAVDRENASALGLKSNLTLPLSVGGKPPVGALALNTVRTHRGWPDDLVKRLQLVAQVFTNALARKRADEALRESEELSRLTFEQAAMGIAHIGMDGRWLRVNDRLCAILGYPREDLLRLTVQDITYSPDLAMTQDHLGQLRSGARATCTLEKRCHHKDQSLVWIYVSISLARSATGEPRHFISVVEDITQRKVEEEARRASEARLAAAADLAGLGFFEVDYIKGTTYQDDRFEALCGPHDGNQGLGRVRFWMDHVHPDDRLRVTQLGEDLIGGKTDHLAMEYRYLHETRGETWIDHVARVVARDEGGRPLKTLGVIRDVTASKQAEENLRRSLAEIGRLKDRLQAESDYLKAEIGLVLAKSDLIGQSAGIKDALHRCEQVAPTTSTVLIQGETGTGKELLAQTIHRMSPRGRHVMVKVNCAALPSGLVESELFGREKGAFTGALTRQIGRFEVADASTIFLDEVGELPLEVQAKLLRVLQEGEFERLGSPRTFKVDVRVIAATNRDLAAEVRGGRFREDLYFRLAVFPIRMPPLRERPDDVPLLVWTFLEEFSSRMGKKISQVTRATMEALQRHPWPGNIRELRNVIEHGAIITSGDTLKIPTLGESEPAPAPPQSLADVEREHILQALESAGWQVKGSKGAAAALGLNPATLYSRMKKAGIRPRRREGGSTS